MHYDDPADKGLWMEKRESKAVAPTEFQKRGKGGTRGVSSTKSVKTKQNI